MSDEENTGGKQADPPLPLPEEFSEEQNAVPWFDGTVEIAISGEAPKRPPAPPAAEPGDPTPDELGRSAGGLRSWLVDHGKIAEGGMSVIHEVQDQSIRRRAAMKILKAQITTPRIRRRFLEEAQITSQLDHPNIPPVHDLWIDDQGNIRFTMKLVKGDTLGDILDASGPGERDDHELSKLLRIFVKVCDAISFAHSHGVIHRDIKPENIMVGSHGQVWVMDWGCAFLLPGEPADDGQRVEVERDPDTECLDLPKTAIGTPAYMSPEQASARTDRLGPRSDVYLLGGVLYEILTDHAPHQHEDIVTSLKRAQVGVVQDPRELVGEDLLPPELCRIAIRALQPSLNARYASVGALKSEIETALQDGWWFKTATFPVGTVVVQEGDPADAAYIIQKGGCEVYHVEDDARVFLRKMGPGDAFGETAIFTEQSRSATVEVTEEMTATVVTPESFERAMGSDSWMGIFVRALAERFREVDSRLAHLRKF